MSNEDICWWAPPGNISLSLVEMSQEQVYKIHFLSFVWVFVSGIPYVSHILLCDLWPLSLCSGAKLWTTEEKRAVHVTCESHDCWVLLFDTWDVVCMCRSESVRRRIVVLTPRFEYLCTSHLLRQDLHLRPDCFWLVFMCVTENWSPPQLQQRFLLTLGDNLW